MTASVLATPSVTPDTLSTGVGVLVPPFVTAHHEPRSRVQGVGVELALQVPRGEGALVDPVAGAVVERALLEALGRDAVPQGAVDYDQRTQGMGQCSARPTPEDVARRVDGPSVGVRRVRKPVPQAMSRVRAAGKAATREITSASSVSQPGRWRLANRPSPSYHSSYSRALRS